MDPVWCEQCGESEAEVVLKYANLCSDCAGGTIGDMTKDIFPYTICGQPLFKNGSLMAICVKPWGTEHDHDLS
jgi:hypothetical protein